jgi:hypothetical protein
MPVHLRGVAVLAMSAILTTPALAQNAPASAPPPPDATSSPAPDAAPDTPSSPPADAPPEDAPPPLSAEELKKLQESLGADSAEASKQQQPAGVPDLSKVNVAAVLPQALQSMNPDISVVMDGAAAAFSVDQPLQRGGHDPNKNGFFLQQVEMSIGASVDPFFRFDSNIVFTATGVEVEEAYATTLALPGNLQLRAGQFLTRFGRINATHPHSWHFIDQNLVVGTMWGGEGNRNPGAEASWLAPLPWFLEVVASLNTGEGECCMRSYLGGEDIGIKSPLDLVATAAVKQFFPLGDDLSLMWGVSGQTGPNPTGNGNRTDILGTDAYLRYRPVAAAGRWSLNLEAEAVYRARQVPFGVLRDGGGYATFIWQIDPNWETGLRYDVLTGVSGDPLDPEATTWRHRETAQVTYYPSHFSRLRVQASLDEPTYSPDPPIVAVMASLEVVVGAHGAHAY